ncbi:hypothetical protein M426DRAFT_9971 [Hypoxylon sp. CI-4A]|nr:hypothetical protein M426DRAFT_9971 [Hypoxylon sp. CI-4A]
MIITKTINPTVPISGPVFIVIALMLNLEVPKTPILAGIRAIDWVGSLALVGGLLMFLLGLEFGGTVYPWDSVTVICLLVFGVATVMLFVAVERYFSQYPIVPVRLYSNLSNFATIVVDLFHGIVLTTNTYFLPLYCQSVLGAEPLLSGVLLLPFAFFMSPKIILYQIIAGFGVGLDFQPPLIALQNNVPVQDNAAATASG